MELEAAGSAFADPARLARLPGVQRVPTAAVTLLIVRNFLGPDECAELASRIDLSRRPSTIADANGDAYFRTSETCDLPGDDPFIASIDNRIADWLGVDPRYGEPLQGQRYAVGQEFKSHTDYFDPQGQDYAKYCAHAGNRTWTCMVYLDEPEDGGATRFPRIGKTIRPERGKMIAWNNRTPEGLPNPDTLHHGMKVRKGVKRVITKWFREKPWQS